MKKLFTVLITLLLVAAFAVGNMVYDDAYFKKYFQYQENTDRNPVYQALKELNGDGTASNRGFSPSIWDNCPVYKFEHDPSSGFVYFNDFKDGVTVTYNKTAAQAAALGTTGTGITCCTAATPGTVISTLAYDMNSIVNLVSTTDDEDVIFSVLGCNNTAGGVSFRSGKKLWMECRIARTYVDDNDMNLFVGFAEEGLVATTTFWSTSDAIADKDYVGFITDIDREGDLDGSVYDTSYNTAGASGVPANVGTGEVTLVAATFTKLGMYFDGTTLTFYQDGVALDSTIDYDATGFPDGEEMAFYIAIMLSSGDNAAVWLDWIRIASEAP